VAAFGSIADLAAAGFLPWLLSRVLLLSISGSIPFWPAAVF
jgi:hypothetical protein